MFMKQKLRKIYKILMIYIKTDYKINTGVLKYIMLGCFLTIVNKIKSIDIEYVLDKIYTTKFVNCLKQGKYKTAPIIYYLTYLGTNDDLLKECNALNLKEKYEQEIIFFEKRIIYLKKLITIFEEAYDCDINDKSLLT